MQNACSTKTRTYRLLPFALATGLPTNLGLAVPFKLPMVPFKSLMMPFRLLTVPMVPFKLLPLPFKLFMMPFKLVMHCCARVHVICLLRLRTLDCTLAALQLLWTLLVWLSSTTHAEWSL